MKRWTLSAIRSLAVSLAKKLLGKNAVLFLAEALGSEALDLVLTKKLFGDHVAALLVRSDNGLFAVDPEDRVVEWTLRRQGSYGLDEIDRVKRLIGKTDSRVLVVGAHIGMLAIPLSKFCREVTAVEANPDTYALLEINIRLNGALNCRPVNVAASDREEAIGFLLDRVNSGGSKRVPKIKHDLYYRDHPAQITVRAAALDDYLAGKEYDLVLMDIEGSEYFALKGMKRILGRSKALVMEFLPHALRNVSGVSIEQLLSVIPGYQFLTIPSLGLKVDAPRFLSTLTDMVDRDLCDEGIIFEKAS